MKPKNPSRKFILAATSAVAALASAASAATAFNNADAANTYITNAGNWDDGLPTGGKQGTINENAGYTSDEALSGYDILHQAGTISRAAGNGGMVLQNNSTWVTNGAGASFSSNVRGIVVESGSSFSLVNGTIATESGRDTRSQNANSTLTVNGGSFSVGRNLIITDSGTFTISGGSMTVAGAAGSVGFANTGIMNFNGGTTTADRFVFKTGTTATFGGSSAGSATFNDWGTGNYTSNLDRQQDNQIIFDFLSGTGMTLTLSAAARALDLTNDSTDNPTTLAWAEALWNADQLMYNGQSASDLSLSWADATNSGVGLGDGSYFEFSQLGSFGGSLSLAGIPEPTTGVLALGAASLGFLRRRRSA